jgi:hypothetical protein
MPVLRRLRDAASRDEAINAPRFNVFRALEIERNEDVCHTRMLAHLLDPSASHGQGTLFLKAFLIAASRHQRFVLPRGPLEEGYWLIQKEFFAGAVDGYIDLLIENARKRYLLVVENKIDSGEHGDQRTRYRNWMETNRPSYECRQLVYLTPDGRPPKSASGAHCVCLSYVTHIVDFLRAASREVQAVSVREAVRQYLSALNEMESNGG